MRPPESPSDNQFVLMKPTLENQLYNYLHELILRYGGGLLPSAVDLSGVQSVVDVACGSGEWTCEFARTHPHIRTLGIEREPERVRYARARARVLGLDNVEFVEGDFRDPRLQECGYDLVHGRLLAPDVCPGTWFDVLQDMLRLARSGGIVVWTEASYPESYSSAWRHWCDLIGKASQNIACMPAVVPCMHNLLSDAGCLGVQRIITTIDFSYDTPAHQTLTRSAGQTLNFALPFLVHAEVTTAEEYERLREQTMAEMLAHSFVGRWKLITVAGIRWRSANRYDTP